MRNLPKRHRGILAVNRKRIAFFSPLKPVRSGIADYSEKLLPYLEKYYEIHLFGHDIPPSSPEIRNRFRWSPRRDYELERRRNDYALNLYQIGNHYCHQFIYPVMARYPGVVFLHDANVHHARAYSHLGHRNLIDYLDELEWCHGDDGRRVGPALAHGYHSPFLYDRFPMLRTVCEGALSVIVHNRFAADRVREHLPADRIFQAPHPCWKVAIPSYAEARQQLGIFGSDPVIASFGFITPEKGIDSILAAFEMFNREYPGSRLVLAGSALDEEFNRWLQDTVSRIHGVTVTGYLSENDFNKWLAACDICIALRYPTQGESSDAVIRIMGAGKPVIVPAYRQFLELPDETCVHVPVWPNEPLAVLEALRELNRDRTLAAAIGKKAHEYIDRNHTADQWIKAVVDAIERSLKLPAPEPLSARCHLRHIRSASVEESIALSVYTWGDLAADRMITEPLAAALEELGIDDETG